jgi:four helix bundle protein
MMDKKELEHRTKRFAIRVIKFANSIERSSAGRVIGKQLLRSGTSIGANYREANRAASRRDFIHKINITEKEASETQYWLEICADTALGAKESVEELAQEAGELLAIFTSIGRSVRRNDRRSANSRNNRVSETGDPRYGDDSVHIEIADLIPESLATQDDS